MRHPPPAAPELAPLRRRLLAWYRRSRRDLPWRRTRDPYRIWVAEIMLQQTRADVVVPYYERFLARFPDVGALACAPLARVLELWSGLGYYGRARNLHAGARRIVAEHGGRFPSTPGAVEALPGVGPYTAGAIRSIAFGQRAPILDGNVVRVFARLFRMEGDVEAAAERRLLWEWAGRWAEGSDPGAANQALMELGATLCTKPVPACDRCPLAADCRAHRSGRQRMLPRPRRRPATQRVRMEAALAARDGRLLVVRRRTGTLLRDWWDLPACRVAPNRASLPLLDRHDAAAPPGAAVASLLRERFGFDLARARALGVVRHGILAHRLEVAIVSGVARGERGVKRPAPAARPAALKTPAPPAASRRKPAARTAPATAAAIATFDLDDLELRWVEPAECRALPLATLARKALRLAAACEPAWSSFVGSRM